MGKKDRKKKKGKPPPRRKPRPSDFASAVAAASGEQRPPRSAAEQAPRLIRRLRSLQVANSEDEHPADVAVCHPRKVDQRDPEWAADVDVVRDALKFVSSGKDEQARDALRRIPRRSPLSQWRMFISGLIEWYAGEIEQAESVWQRLDPSRRPARIAAVLCKASRPPAPAGEDTAAGDGATTPASPVTTARPLDDAALENRAALVRMLRVERLAVEELAKATTRSPLPGEGAKFPMPLVDWIVSWRGTYQRFEPDLVRAAQRNALALAFDQPEAPVFERLCKAISGPLHDPKNRLYLSQYLDMFHGAEGKAERLRRVYLREDLPGCGGLSEPTRAAMESLMHLREARESQAPPVRGLFSRFMGPPDTREAEAAFKSAIKAYPTNRAAHREYVDLIRHSGEPYDDTKKDEEARNRRIRRVMERWSKSLPDDVEPRLWLVSHYLENEELELAEPHVEMLQRQRLQDPRIRALPWRWALFESMRLARHKRRVAQAREQLDKAESLWPEWLSKAWLPFLRAALACRAGEKESYQRLRDEAEGSVDRQPLLSNIMLFAALRRMYVPSGELKALRQTIAALTDDTEQIDTVDLLKTGGFLWDLDRTDMFYTGYRTHGPQLIQELTYRLGDRDLNVPNELLGPAALWCAGNRFACDKRAFYIPALVKAQKTTDPLVGASVLRALADTRFARQFATDERETFEFVKGAAETARDPFYCHYMQTLVDEVVPLMTPSRPATRFGDDDVIGGSWDDDDDDDEWDEEEELCNCIDCRRARGELDPEVEADEGPAPDERVMAQMFDEMMGMLTPAMVEEMRQEGVLDAETHAVVEAIVNEKQKNAKRR